MKKYLSIALITILFLQPVGEPTYAEDMKEYIEVNNTEGFRLETGGERLNSDEIDYKEIIRKLDKKLIWKMVIDGRYHCKGKYICDNGGKVADDLYAAKEPGYLKAMLRAFEYMVGTIDKDKLDENLFREFHKKALTKVGIHYKFDCTDYWGDTKEHASFPVGKRNSTEAGKKELFEKKKDGWKCERLLKPKIHKVDNKPGNRLFGYVSKTPKEARNFAKTAFETYYEKLDELAKNGEVEGTWLPDGSSLEDKKLEIIIRICQCLDQAHTFYDGNIRTIVFLTMNKMLVENGLSPVCMWNPNCLDMMDVKTLIGKVKEGQDEFRKIFVK